MWASGINKFWNILWTAYLYTYKTKLKVSFNAHNYRLLRYSCYALHLPQLKTKIRIRKF